MKDAECPRGCGGPVIWLGTVGNWRVGVCQTCEQEVREEVVTQTGKG